MSIIPGTTDSDTGLVFEDNRWMSAEEFDEKYDAREEEQEEEPNYDVTTVNGYKYVRIRRNYYLKIQL